MRGLAGQCPSVHLPVHMRSALVLCYGRVVVCGSLCVSRCVVVLVFVLVLGQAWASTFAWRHRGQAGANAPGTKRSCGRRSRSVCLAGEFALPS